MNVYSYYYNNPYAEEDFYTITDYSGIQSVNNAFIASVEVDGDVFYSGLLVLPGELFLHFCWGEDVGFVSYGISSKIN